MKKIFIFVLISIFLISMPVSALVSDWNVLKTDNFEVFYPDAYYHYAEETLYYLEKYREEMIQLTGNDDDFKTRVVIEDEGLLSNGYAMINDRKIGLYTNTPSSYFPLSSNESWLASTAIHEFVHIAQFQNTSGLPGVIRTLGGNYYSPNTRVPLWLAEGIAVYGESLPSDYDGRLNDGYYHALVRDKIEHDNLADLLDVPYRWEDDDYFYGALLLDYLAKEYGEESLGEYFADYGANEFNLLSLYPLVGEGLLSLFPRISFDRSAREIYGKSFNDLFSEWKEYEIANHTPLEETGEVIIDGTIDDKEDKIIDFIIKDDKIYYIIERELYYLEEYDLASGESRVLKKFNSSLPPAGVLEFKEGRLYYGLKDIEIGFASVDGFGLAAKLYSYDLSSGESEEIFSDNFKEFTVLEGDEQKIIYSKEAKGSYGSEIWQYKVGEKEKLGQVDYEVLEIEGSVEALITVSKKHGQAWGINYLDLDTLSFTPIIESPYLERFVRVDGDEFYFTANYEGYYRLYSYNLKDERLTKLSDSHYASNGFVYGDQLYAIGLNDGRVIYKDSPLEIEYNISENISESKRSLESEVDYSLDGVREKDSVKRDNFKYLFKPWLRFPAVVGEDALGTTEYFINYIGQPGIELSTQILSPLTINFSSFYDSYNNLGSRPDDNYLSLSYPIYNSLTSTLRSVNFFYETDFNRNRVGSNIRFFNKMHSLDLDIIKDFKSEEITPEVNYNYEVNHNYLDNLNLNARKADDFQNRDRTERLYFDNEDDEYNYHLALDVLAPLFSIERGLWNPNIFVDELFVNPFVEAAQTDDYTTRSFGFELQLHIGTGFESVFVPKLGFYRSNRDDADTINTYISYEYGFSF